MSMLLNKTIKIGMSMFFLSQFDTANAMIEETDINKQIIILKSSSMKPNQEDKKKDLSSSKERFGHGDSLSSIRAATGPSFPIYADNYKVVFSSIDPRDLPFAIVH